MSYVDTSIIVAALDYLDPRQKSALEVLEKKGDKKISELVLVELASILSRKRNILYEAFRKIGVKEELTIPAAILYIVKRFRLEYKRVYDHGRVLPLGDFYLPLATAIELSSKFKLKTLDLLHLAYIKTLIDQEEEIYELITVDEDFKKEEESIKRELKIDIKTLDNLL
jgi:predicted nucleic acid-binding protein